MARIEVDGIEESIIKAIVAERATFHACTARQLSRRIGYHHSYISEVLQRMKLAEGFTDRHRRSPLGRNRSPRRRRRTDVRHERRTADGTPARRTRT